MKKLAYFLLFSLSFFVLTGFGGCQATVNALASAAEAGLNTEANAETDADLKAKLTTLATKVESFRIVFNDWAAASSAAKPGYASQIETAANDLTADSNVILALIGVKNSNRLQIVKVAIASVDAVIVAVQSQAPSPSGNSVQLNSTVAEMKAAVK